jgi:hypothetical protein
MIICKPLKEIHSEDCPTAILLNVQNDHVIPSYWVIALRRLRQLFSLRL